MRSDYFERLQGVRDEYDVALAGLGILAGPATRPG